MTGYERADGPGVISFVGAGGKTTSMLTLARECREAGERLLVTTTTAIYKPEKEPFDRLWIEAERSDCLEEQKTAEGITIWGDRITEDRKLKGMPLKRIEDFIVKNQYDRFLIESDGSREKPLKAPGEHEPLISKETELVVGVVGMSALEQRVSEAWIHRSQLFCQITGTSEGELITAEKIVKLVIHPEGLFKSAPMGAKRVLLLNQTDSERRRQQAKNIASGIRQSNDHSAGKNPIQVLATSFDPFKYQLVWSEIL